MAKTERPSGYIRDVAAWNGSRAVQRMNFSERGVYQAMLDEQWERRWLPDDPDLLADRIAITPEQRAEVLAAWPKVRTKFVAAESGLPRIYNARLEKTRRTQRARFVLRQEAGRAAGKASAAKRLADKALPINESLTDVERSSTVLEKSSREESSSDQRREVLVPVTARSKRPIFTGQRLTVFEWQLDNCTKTLGPFTNDFDLHAWFGRLDGEAMRTAMVIPQRDNGAWLNARLLEECQRRGLPVARADVPAAGKLTTRLGSALANIAREG